MFVGRQRLRVPARLLHRAAAAQQAQFKANRLIALLIRFGVVCGIKEILDMLGYDCGYQVYPQKRFTDDERQAFRAALKEINFEETYI